MSDDKPNILILNKHKNELYKLIEQAGLNPREFRAKEETIGGRHYFIMEHLGTRFRYGVRAQGDHFEEFDVKFTQMAPSFPLSDFLSIAGYRTVAGLYSDFQSWLRKHLKPYLSDLAEPDLWAQIQSQAPIVSNEPVGSDDLEPFTQPEQAQLRMAIKEFRQLIIDKFEHTEEHLSLIDDRLDYLAESLDRLNRIDWRSVAFSTLVSVTSTLSLNNEQGNQLYELFKQVFSNVVRLLQ